MNILIIGGTGVLSSAVTNEALKKNIFVTMINRGNRCIPEGVEHIKADVKNQDIIEERLAGRQFDAVIDFLCYTDDQTISSYTFYSKYTKQYFYISSCAVYDTTKSTICSEDSPKVLPIWKYSVDKWDSEKKLMELSKNTNTPITIIRPCVTYGNTRIPYGIAPTYGFHWTLAARILAGKPIIRWNGGNNRCNMTRVEDFAVGVIGLIGNINAYGEAFNVCGDETPSFNDVLNAMSEYLQKKVITCDVTSEFYAKELPDRAGEILGGRSIDAINCNTKIKRVVPEFKQTIFLKAGIKKTLDDYRTQNYQHGIDWKFDAGTDRIIMKWCKENNIDYKQYNLGFVDYLGSATKKNRIIYYLEKNKESAFVRFILRTYSIILLLKKKK